MEGLRNESRRIYQDQKFLAPKDYPDKYPLVEVVEKRNGAAAENIYSRCNIPSLDLVHHPGSHASSTCRSSRDGEAAIFRLVGLSMTRYHEICCHKEQFDSLFARFQLDNYMRCMVTSDVMGYHQFLPGNAPRASRVASFFLSNVSYVFLWSYNFDTLSTSAIMIGRNSGAAFEEFLHHLELQRSLAPHPLLIPFVVSIQLHMFAHKCVGSQMETIREVEKKKKIGDLWSPEIVANPFLQSEKGTRNDVSQQMSKTLIQLEDMLRHLKFAQSLQKMVTGQKGAQLMRHVRSETIPSIQFKTQAIKNAVGILLPQVRSATLAISFLQRRARNQITTINNFIAQSDAEAGIAVAINTRRDSSSMKVLAVMTMAFLPGTFFAALFSVPSLAPGVQDKYWLYWAFALPTTALVFLVWFLITKKHRLVAWLSEKDPAGDLRSSSAGEVETGRPPGLAFDLGGLKSQFEDPGSHFQLAPPGVIVSLAIAAGSRIVASVPGRIASGRLPERLHSAKELEEPKGCSFNKNRGQFCDEDLMLLPRPGLACAASDGGYSFDWSSGLPYVSPSISTMVSPTVVEIYIAP
ncbi:hypothetical protein MKZ38_010385 [Zalerion maritima]|uniref:Uncharacterized protein n=1 Tax=Zalerion maritima TaxID=339359 RepID=A0AAD5RSI1_9PEZI|nr:hypothetical protein MKZ38_010385 [Zalerion maritima]